MQLVERQPIGGQQRVYQAMDAVVALLESWDRQCRIVNAVAGRVDESNKHAKPSPDGWPLYEHLAHIHKVRKYHLDQLDAEGAAKLADAFRHGWRDPVDDLDAIRGMLDASALAVRDAVKSALEADKGKVGGYDHPVFFLQHLVWHEGWHVGLIFLGLRLAGQEPPEAWEETHVWGEWRTD